MDPQPPVAQTHARARAASVLGVLAVLALALCLRAVPLKAGEPYLNYVDEGHVLKRSAHLIDHTTWDPDWYTYPPLLAETTAGVALIGDAAFDFGLAEGADVTDSSDRYDVIEPYELMFIGRLLVLLASVATVGMVMVLGQMLLGRTAAFAAGLVAAVLPALVGRASIVIVDTIAAAMVMGALCAGWFALSRHKPKWIVAASAFAGRAFTAKYTSGAVLIPVVVFAVAGAPRQLGRQVRAVAAALVPAAIAVVVTMPSLVLRPGAVLDDLRASGAAYLERGGRRSYLSELLSPSEVGWLLAAFAVIGLVVMVRRQQTRLFTLAWFGFAFVLLGSLLTTSYQPFRNVLPLLPVLCVAAAAGLEAVVELAARRLPRVASASGAVVIGLTSVWCAFTVVAETWPLQHDKAEITDSRVLAKAWLQENTTEDDRVLVAAELSFLPSELEQIPAEVVTANFLTDPPRRAEVRPHVTSLDIDSFDYVVAGTFDGSAWQPGGRDQAELSVGSSPTRGLPNGWTGNLQRIRIYASGR